MNNRTASRTARSSKSQVHVLTALLFLLLIPTTIIIAQNAPLINGTLEGNLILDDEIGSAEVQTPDTAAGSDSEPPTQPLDEPSDAIGKEEAESQSIENPVQDDTLLTGPPDSIGTEEKDDQTTPSDPNQTEPTTEIDTSLPVDTARNESIAEPAVNESTEDKLPLPEEESQSINITAPEQNETEQANGTVDVTIGNETGTAQPVQNETNETAPDEALPENISLPVQNETQEINETENVTGPLLNETINITEPENQTDVTTIPVLNVEIISPPKITRGESFSLEALISNTGSGTAKNVVAEWIIPEGFTVISGGKRSECGTLYPDSVCSTEITVSTSYSTNLGKASLRVVVRYG